MAENRKDFQQIGLPLRFFNAYLIRSDLL